jgi:hypothetical protein
MGGKHEKLDIVERRQHVSDTPVTLVRRNNLLQVQPDYAFSSVEMTRKPVPLASKASGRGSRRAYPRKTPEASAWPLHAGIRQLN